jgi:sensory rhodopsin
MDPVTIAYAVAAATFVLGTGIVVALYVSLDGSPHQLPLAGLAIIPGFAGISYAVMAFGVGTVDVGGTTLVGFRYVDWLVTTPLLVGYIGYAAGASRRAIAGVMIADALMIVAGAGAVITGGTLKWGLFALSVLFHASLFVYLYGVFPQQVPDAPMQRGLFSLLKNHIGLLWIAYPFVWLMGPAGLGVAGFVGVSLIYAFLDVLAKIPYVYFFYARRRIFTDVVTTEMDKGVTPAD